MSQQIKEGVIIFLAFVAVALLLFIVLIGGAAAFALADKVYLLLSP